MITKHYVIEHHGQFICRFYYGVTLLNEDLSSARLFPTVNSAREIAQIISRRLGIHPAEFKVRSVHADLDIAHPRITMSARCTGASRNVNGTPSKATL